jgi:hypothetical protein
MGTLDVRERQVNIRLSEQESDLLELVSKHYGLNGANLFRMFITREANALRAQAPSAIAEPKKPASEWKKPKKSSKR